MRFPILAVACLLTTGTVAEAQDTMPAPSAPPAAKAKPERKLCRSEGTTGSMLGKRVCHTNNEWKQIDTQSNQDASNFRDQVNRSGAGAGQR